ncbi:DUF28 domain protein [Cordyceps fumosorosea ARSEF 2679]|uniref:DUF28 domain protein n=1 Tax=Cordyceps fumosorosea (strain ARSEF 2679) TaxID=1081104 RepID=A0A168ER61_CORFA|nr:DUF28 domain protein [Cordyceps fumosorosea ARSEF 2679]OAA74116.1 DUF28 domain protein [Cordyceps fumosorosea ARSEF 2679]
MAPPKRFAGALAQLVLRPTATPRLRICPACRQHLSTTRPQEAGHNKWSKTKHIKAVTDKKKMVERTAFTKLITMYSRMYGDDVQYNPALASAIAAANKASIPKALIEGAIASGQGKSATGAKLEPMTMEFLLPPDIALILDIETDSKQRTLQDLKLAVKKAGGITGSTAFNFARRGRAVFSLKDGAAGIALSDLLDEAIEHDGAQDVEEEEGSYVLWTEPSVLVAIAKAFATKFDLELRAAEIVWAPNENTMVKLDSDDSAAALSSLLATLKEHAEVKAIFANTKQGRAGDEAWEAVERHLDV